MTFSPPSLIKKQRPIPIDSKPITIVFCTCSSPYHLYILRDKLPLSPLFIYNNSLRFSKFVILLAIENHHLHRFQHESIFLTLSSLNPLNKNNTHYASGRNWRVLPTGELRRLFRATDTMRKPERNLHNTRKFLQRINLTRIMIRKCG